MRYIENKTIFLNINRLLNYFFTTRTNKTEKKTTWKN